MLGLSEKDFQERVVQTAKLLGWMTYHTYDSRRSEPGFPDLVMIHRVRETILVRELKSMKGKTTLPQQQWLAAFALLGIDSGVWRPDGILDGSIVETLKGAPHA
ncbi:VRR-NUC domain-containing protein [Arthrobacter sp. SX1312]|uniref:VRR-NUC domain-containing protein n=1 Tax=Arthrobacter sp. SX1312 TaxID=2058896 RepID=UPI0021574937|nr:VRR-NUC domain-containing protein [Arthrobacter sp. SX1312]